MKMIGVVMIVSDKLLDKNTVIEQSIEIKDEENIKNKDKKQGRISYVDTARAIAIFLTIVSHSGLQYHPINQFICSFHMPLFFFISGWTQKNKKIEGVKGWIEFITKKICMLLVPYLLYALIYCKGADLNNYKYIFYGSIFSLRKAGSVGAMWFLTCMFSASIIYQIITNICSSIKNKKISNISLIAIIVLCGCISSYFDYNRMPKIGLPFQVNVALSGVVFMFVGNFVSKLYKVFSEKYNMLKMKRVLLPISIIILILGSFLYKLNFEAFTFEKYNFGVVMGEAWYGNYIVFLLNAIICSIGIILLSMVIDNKFLGYFGKNTIIILYFHTHADSLTRKYITTDLTAGTYKYFVNSILVFLEMGLIIPIINKFFPNLAGKYISNKT